MYPERNASTLRSTFDGATHRGLPAHPKVLEAITHRLAQPEGQWRPFHATGTRAIN